METQQCYVPKMRYCIPYLDHSYASELPGLPEDAVEGSLVPDSLGAFVDIEDSSHNIGNDTSIYHQENDQEDEEDRSHFNGNGYSSYNQKYKATVSNDEEDWSDSVTRCICDFQHDDGFMISCDRCCVWQHVDCMGLNKNNIPETYLCELCLPRPIDKRRAIRLQIHKKEALDAENSKNDNRGYSNRSNQSSGGKVAETGISSDESSDGGIQLAEVSRTGRKRKLKRVDDDQFTTFNTNRKNHKQQVNNNIHHNIHNNHVNRKHTSEIRPAKVPSENLYSKSYSHKRARFNSNDDGSSYNDNTNDKVCLNTFTPSINNIVAQLNNNPTLNFNNHHNSNFSDANFNNYLQSMSPPSSTSSSSPLNIHTMALIKKQIRNIAFKPSNLSHGVGVIATETLRNGQGIAEFMGIVSTENEYVNSSNFDPCYKGVMAYNLDDKHAVVIDGRSFNTSIKHIKSSCSPNAKLVHSTEGGVLRFYVVACKNISMGKEITLPMHHNYREMDVEMVCVCGKTSCSVVKFYKNKNRTKRPLKIKSPDLKKLNQSSLLSGTQSDQQNPAELLSLNKGYMDYLATAATLSSMLTIDNNKPNNNNNFIISNNQIISADSNANTISPSTNNDINNTLNDIQNYLASEGATEIDNPLINSNSESFNDNSTNEVFTTNANATPAPITNINDFFNNPTPTNNIDYNSTNTNRSNILDALTDSMDSFGSNDDIMPLIIAEPQHKKSNKS